MLVWRNVNCFERGTGQFRSDRILNLIMIRTWPKISDWTRAWHEPEFLNSGSARTWPEHEIFKQIRSGNVPRTGSDIPENFGKFPVRFELNPKSEIQVQAEIEANSFRFRSGSDWTWNGKFRFRSIKGWTWSFTSGSGLDPAWVNLN